MKRWAGAHRARGKAFQPRFGWAEILGSWLGGLVAITALGLIGAWSHDALVVARFGASTVAAAVSVASVALCGTDPWVMGLAVGVTIALGQLLRCLHPPAGAVAPLS